MAPRLPKLHIVEWIVVASIGGILSILGYIGWREYAHPCVHPVNCREETFTTFVQAGDVTVPFLNTETVCDCLERAP